MIATGLLLYAIVAFIAIAANPPLGWALALPLLLAVAFSGDSSHG